MRKEIRLLLEGFFDDDIFNPNDINLDILEIGDQYYNYQVGDIYYENNKPYAICCGDKSDFKDEQLRFVLTNKEKQYIWGRDFYYIYNCDDLENGYKNTLTIKYGLTDINPNIIPFGAPVTFNLNEYPAFKYCIKLDENAYLPAINELYILFKNLHKINNILKKLKCILIKISITYCSSTTVDPYNILVFNFRHGECYFGKKNKMYYVRPFILIKK